MNGYNFTDRVRKVLQFAREEAARLGHEYVGTEHLLLGIIREGDGVAVAALTNLNTDVEEVRARIEAILKPGSATRDPNRDLPYTSRAKKILELSIAEARELNHSYVGTEHLLLGTLREEKGIAAQALAEVGVAIASARDEIRRILGEADEFKPVPNFSREADRRFKRAIALVELHRTRFGTYPQTFKDLQFLDPADYTMLAGTRYELLPDGYALDVVVPTGTVLELSYPSDFWRGLGLRRTNMPGGPAAV